MSKQKSSAKEQRRQEAKKQQRKKTLTIAIPIVLVAIALIALVAIRSVGRDIQGVFDFGVQEQGHDEGVEFVLGSLPPVGGVHSSRFQNCGIYTEPVEVKNAVHSMEHGAVWIAYDPSLADDQVTQLQNLVRGQSYLLLSPYPGLDGPVVLTAWGIQLQVDSPADERVAQFINQYRLGPQTPEFGAACEGGLGSPIS